MSQYEINSQTESLSTGRLDTVDIGDEQNEIFVGNIVAELSKEFASGNLSMEDRLSSGFVADLTYADDCKKATNGVNGQYPESCGGMSDVDWRSNGSEPLTPRSAADSVDTRKLSQQSDSEFGSMAYNSSGSKLTSTGDFLTPMTDRDDFINNGEVSSSSGNFSHETSNTTVKDTDSGRLSNFEELLADDFSHVELDDIKIDENFMSGTQILGDIDNMKPADLLSIVYKGHTSGDSGMSGYVTVEDRKKLLADGDDADITDESINVGQYNEGCTTPTNNTMDELIEQQIGPLYVTSHDDYPDIYSLDIKSPSKFQQDDISASGDFLENVDKAVSVKPVGNSMDGVTVAGVMSSMNEQFQLLQNLSCNVDSGNDASTSEGPLTDILSDVDDHILDNKDAFLDKEDLMSAQFLGAAVLPQPTMSLQDLSNNSLDLNIASGGSYEKASVQNWLDNVRSDDKSSEDSSPKRALDYQSLNQDILEIQEGLLAKLNLEKIEKESKSRELCEQFLDDCTDEEQNKRSDSPDDLIESEPNSIVEDTGLSSLLESEEGIKEVEERFERMALDLDSGDAKAKDVYLDNHLPESERSDRKSDNVSMSERDAKPNRSDATRSDATQSDATRSDAKPADATQPKEGYAYSMAEKVNSVFSSVPTPQTQTRDILKQVALDEDVLMRKLGEKDVNQSAISDDDYTSRSVMSDEPKSISETSLMSIGSNFAKGRSAFEAYSNVKSFLSTQMEKMQQRQFNTSIELRTPMRQKIISLINHNEVNRSRSDTDENYNLDSDVVNYRTTALAQDSHKIDDFLVQKRPETEGEFRLEDTSLIKRIDNRLLKNNIPRSPMTINETGNKMPVKEYAGREARSRDQIEDDVDDGYEEEVVDEVSSASTSPGAKPSSYAIARQTVESSDTGTLSDSDYRWKATKPSLRPYRPTGSKEMYYTESENDDKASVAESGTTMESTHIGSDDAIAPEFPASALGSRRTIVSSNGPGLYSKPDSLFTIEEKSLSVSFMEDERESLGHTLTASDITSAQTTNQQSRPTDNQHHSQIIRHAKAVQDEVNDLINGYERSRSDLVPEDEQSARSSLEDTSEKTLQRRIADTALKDVFVDLRNADVDDRMSRDRHDAADNERDRLDHGKSPKTSGQQLGERTSSDGRVAPNNKEHTKSRDNLMKPSDGSYDERRIEGAANDSQMNRNINRNPYSDMLKDNRNSSIDANQYSDRRDITKLTRSHMSGIATDRVNKPSGLHTCNTNVKNIIGIINSRHQEGDATSGSAPLYPSDHIITHHDVNSNATNNSLLPRHQLRDYTHAESNDNHNASNDPVINQHRDDYNTHTTNDPSTQHTQREHDRTNGYDVSTHHGTHEPDALNDSETIAFERRKNINRDLRRPVDYDSQPRTFYHTLPTSNTRFPANRDHESPGNLNKMWENMKSYESERKDESSVIEMIRDPSKHFILRYLAEKEAERETSRKIREDVIRREKQRLMDEREHDKRRSELVTSKKMSKNHREPGHVITGFSADATNNHDQPLLSSTQTQQTPLDIVDGSYSELAGSEDYLSERSRDEKGFRKPVDPTLPEYKKQLVYDSSDTTLFSIPEDTTNVTSTEVTESDQQSPKHRKDPHLAKLQAKIRQQREKYERHKQKERARIMKIHKLEQLIKAKRKGTISGEVLEACLEELSTDTADLSTSATTTSVSVDVESSDSAQIESSTVTDDTLTKVDDSTVEDSMDTLERVDSGKLMTNGYGSPTRCSTREDHRYDARKKIVNQQKKQNQNIPKNVTSKKPGYYTKTFIPPKRPQAKPIETMSQKSPISSPKRLNSGYKPTYKSRDKNDEGNGVQEPPFKTQTVRYESSPYRSTLHKTSKDTLTRKNQRNTGKTSEGQGRRNERLVSTAVQTSPDRGFTQKRNNLRNKSPKRRLVPAKGKVLQENIAPDDSPPMPVKAPCSWFVPFEPPEERPPLSEQNPDDNIADRFTEHNKMADKIYDNLVKSQHVGFADTDSDLHKIYDDGYFKVTDDGYSKKPYKTLSKDYRSTQHDIDDRNYRQKPVDVYGQKSHDRQFDVDKIRDHLQMAENGYHYRPPVETEEEESINRASIVDDLGRYPRETDDLGRYPRETDDLGRYHSRENDYDVRTDDLEHDITRHDRARIDDLIHRDGDGDRMNKNSYEPIFNKFPKDPGHVSLQDALHMHRPEFISHSIKRQRSIAMYIKELQIRECLDDQKQLVWTYCHGGKKRKPTVHIVPPSQRWVSKSDVNSKKNNRRSRQCIPEVVEKERAKKRLAEYRTNRVRARLFSRKVQQQVLDEKK